MRNRPYPLVYVGVGGQKGWVYHSLWLCPTIPACTGNDPIKVLTVRRGPLKEIRLGNIYGATGGSFAGMVYDRHGLCPSLNTGGGGNRQPMIVCCALRGRDDPGYRGRSNGNFEQRLELRQDGCVNTLTTVQKDNMILMGQDRMEAE